MGAHQAPYETYRWGRTKLLVKHTDGGVVAPAPLRRATATLDPSSFLRPPMCVMLLQAWACIFRPSLRAGHAGQCCEEAAVIRSMHQMCWSDVAALLQGLLELRDFVHLNQLLNLRLCGVSLAMAS